MATAADDCCVKLWDLRKLKNFKTLQLDEGYEVRDLSFDSSGSYLAVAGSDVRMYLCKQWDTLKVENTELIYRIILIGISKHPNRKYKLPTKLGQIAISFGDWAPRIKEAITGKFSWP